MEEKQLTEDEIYAQIKERIKGEFIPLFTKEGKAVDVGYNKTTKLVYKDVDQMVSIASHHTEEETKAISEARHKRFEIEAAKKEAATFQKAEKKKFAEWKGEMIFYGEDHYGELCDLLESMFELYGVNFDLYPEYVWATKPEAYITKKDAFEVYERDLEDKTDECDLPVEGVEDLQKALDEFYECNKENILHWPDYSLALLIDDEIEEYRKRYEDE